MGLARPARTASFPPFSRRNAPFQFCDECRQRGAEGVADRAHLNQVEANLAPLHLAQVRLALADALGKLDLRNAGGTPHPS